MAATEKNKFSDIDEGSKEGSSENSSLELSSVYIVPGPLGHNKIHTVPCQYLFGLQMRLEDIRSHMVERNSLGPYSDPPQICHENQEKYESFSYQNTEPTQLDNQSSLRSREYLKIEALEEINDYFFNNLDLIQTMEQRYKSEIDSGYLCGRYYDQLRKLFFDEELRKLEEQRKDLETEKQNVANEKHQLKLTKRSFDSQAQNLKMILQENNDRINLIMKESEALKLKKAELDQAIRNFQEEKLEFDKRKGLESLSDACLTTRANSINEKSPRWTESSSESFKSIIENIKVSLETKSPPDVAISLIENIKTQVREISGYRKTDKIELKYMKHALESRSKALEKYEIFRKNELSKAKKLADNELAKLKNCCDKRSSNYQNLEVLEMIRQKKQCILEAEEEIKLMVNTMYSLQVEIMSSIETFKKSYCEALKQNRELSKNIKQLRIVAMDC